MSGIVYPTRETLLAVEPEIMSRFRSEFEVGDLKTNECWLWRGQIQQGYCGLQSLPYGVFSIELEGQQLNVEAHRLALVFENRVELANGNIGHLCAETLCINPSHLTEMDDQDAKRRVVERFEGRFSYRRIDHAPIWEGWHMPKWHTYAAEEIETIKFMSEIGFKTAN